MKTSIILRRCIKQTSLVSGAFCRQNESNLASFGIIRDVRCSFSAEAASDETITIETESMAQKYYDTHTFEPNQLNVDVVSSPDFACGSSKHETEKQPLPPPLPEPTYSVHKRVLPSSLTALSSPEGRKYLLETFIENTAESYWALTEQFVNQSDPAFCGITTLLMVLNAMSIDPGVRWRGGWRFYGSEEVLLDRCCFSAERVRRVGVNMDEFGLLGKCHGLRVEMKRASIDGGTKNSFSVDSFREDLRSILSDNQSQSILVVSFSRPHLDQTGEGHFSPIAAYHQRTDKVLLLDVARFKYSPYWVSVHDLYDAMAPMDKSTNQARGWFLLFPPTSSIKGRKDTENRRPAELVPQVGDDDACPVGKVKFSGINLRIFAFIDERR